MQRDNRKDLYETLARLLLECRDEMAGAEADQRVRFGLLIAGSTFRVKTLFDQAPHPRAVILTDRQLAVEMSRAFLSYVGNMKEGV